ncbi:MAG TPA: methyltransferase domain-containing protein [Aromatoleum sp.]|uniref:class I SAM-dependent methyltransferase n=1 Tax=Aromatoleum sp. TaxID=2307007 RepID=UPI002B49AE88|nr:methyltransferase domain-containing protein [Aromatoleum sp.]HJV26936.1 methyltransferase domain-containing protein [Aromatoleum sp.]
MPHGVNEAVKTHYGRQDLAEVILAALEEAGADIDRLSLEQLAPIDEFHIRGRAATLELAQAAGLRSTNRVLDIGSGIGGTSRCLAKEFGCRVTGIDLTDEYCQVASMLTEKVGLDGLVDYRQGDATDLPFEDNEFDVVWTEHVAMNIADKRRLYDEMYRVLKPGGTLAIYDVLAGPSGPVLFPVPWARTPDTSFLVSPEELRDLLRASGFTVSDWKDTTAEAREWFVKVVERIRREGFPALGFHLLMGEDFREMAQNQGRNLQDGRISLGQIVSAK